MFRINLAAPVIRSELVLYNPSQRHQFSSIRHVSSCLRNLKKVMEGKVRDKTLIFFHRIRGGESCQSPEGVEGGLERKRGGDKPLHHASSQWEWQAYSGSGRNCSRISILSTTHLYQQFYCVGGWWGLDSWETNMRIRWFQINEVLWRQIILSCEQCRLKFILPKSPSGLREITMLRVNK